MIFRKGTQRLTHFRHPVATCSLSRASLFLVEQSVTGVISLREKNTFQGPWIHAGSDSWRERFQHMSDPRMATRASLPRRNWMNMHSIHKNCEGFVACRRRKAQLTPPTSKSRRVILNANCDGSGCVIKKDMIRNRARSSRESFTNFRRKFYRGWKPNSSDEGIICYRESDRIRNECGCVLSSKSETH